MGMHTVSTNDATTQQIEMWRVVEDERDALLFLTGIHHDRGECQGPWCVSPMIEGILTSMPKEQLVEILLATMEKLDGALDTIGALEDPEMVQQLKDAQQELLATAQEKLSDAIDRVTQKIVDSMETGTDAPEPPADDETPIEVLQERFDKSTIREKIEEFLKDPSDGVRLTRPVRERRAYESGEDYQKAIADPEVTQEVTV